MINYQLKKIIKNLNNQCPSASIKCHRIAINFLVLVMLLIVFGCEEQVDWQFQPQENGALVVDAIITNEFKMQEVRLSLSYSGLNGQPEPVSDAEISISDGQNIFQFMEAPGDAGKYFSEEPFATQLGKIYTLDILWNSQEYSAENEMIAVFPFNTITFASYGETDSLTVNEVAPLYSPDEQAMYEINIDWSHISNVEPNRAKLFFYTFSTIDVNELFKPSKETVAFPKGSIVIEKKYSLNEDFAAFYRALAMETDWQGGVYDENSASLPTNVSNGGVGFFGVSAVLVDTLIAE